MARSEGMEKHFKIKIRWIIFVFIVFSVVETYPLIAKITTHYPGWSGDSFQFLWNQWWMSYALKNGRNPFECSFMYYPEGVQLIAHTFSPLKAFLGVLLMPIVGFIPAFNLIFLCGFVCSGMGMYFLARKYEISQLSALAAGVYFSFSPLRMGTGLGHLNIFSVEWIPWSLYAWLCFSDSGKKLFAVLAGLCLGAAGYCGFNPLVLALIPTLLFIALDFVFRPFRRILRGVFWLGFAFLLVFSPCILMFVQYIQVNGLDIVVKPSDIQSVDVICYFLPAPWHPFWSVPLSRWCSDHISPRKYYSISLGFIGLISIVLFLFTRKKQFRWGYVLILALMGWWLSLGTALEVMGNTLLAGKSMLFYWFEKIPLLKAAREPARFAHVTYLATALMLGFSLDRYLKRPFWKFLIICVIAFEFLFVPYPIIRYKDWRKLKKISSFDQSGAVLQFPIWTQDNVAILFQTIHEHPIFSGMVSRPPQTVLHWLDNHPVFASLAKLQDHRIVMYMDNEISFYVYRKLPGTGKVVVFMIPSGRKLTYILPRCSGCRLDIRKNDRVGFRGWVAVDAIKMTIEAMPYTKIFVNERIKLIVSSASAISDWEKAPDNEVDLLSEQIKQDFKRFGVKYLIFPSQYEKSYLMMLLKHSLHLQPVMIESGEPENEISVYSIKYSYKGKIKQQVRN